MTVLHWIDRVCVYVQYGSLKFGRRTAQMSPNISIELHHVLRALKIDFDKFVHLCILLKCDYCEAIEGMVPAVASGHAFFRSLIDDFGCDGCCGCRRPESSPGSQASSGPP